MAGESVGVTVSAIDRFSAPMGGMVTDLTKFGTSAAGVATILGVGLTMGIKSSVKAASEFQTQMAFVSTMLDSSTIPLMQEFRDELLDMSQEFGEDTATLSRGLYDILSASIPAEKAISVLQIATIAAKGGMTDTAKSADALTTVLNSYQLQAEDAAYVSDVLFNIVKRGKLTYDDLTDSIGTVAALSATAGLSLEELGATIATLTRAGIDSHAAMTAIRGILRAFLKPTDEAKQAAEELGIELNTTTLRGGGLIDVIKTLSQASPELAAKLFPNIRGLTGIAVAMQQVEGFAYDLDVAMKQTGSAQEAFEKSTNTLQFEQNRLKETVNAFKIGLGEEFLPVLNDVIEAMLGAGTQADETGRKFGQVLNVGLKSIILSGQIMTGQWDSAMITMGETGAIIDNLLNPALESNADAIQSATEYYGNMKDSMFDVIDTQQGFSDGTEEINEGLKAQGNALDELTKKYGKYAGVMGAFRTREGIRLGIEMEPGAVRLPSGGTIVDPERFKEWEEQVKEKRGPEAEFKETIADDFVQRPGQPAVRFNPEDTIIGVKGGGGGTGGETVIRNVIILDGREIYNSVNRHTMNEMI